MCSSLNPKREIRIMTWQLKLEKMRSSIHFLGLVTLRFVRGTLRLFSVKYLLGEAERIPRILFYLRTAIKF